MNEWMNEDMSSCQDLESVTCQYYNESSSMQSGGLELQLNFLKSPLWLQAIQILRNMK